MVIPPSQVRIRDLVAVFVLCVVGRAVTTIAISASGRQSFATDLAVQAAMYVILFLACVLHLRKKNPRVADAFGPIPRPALVALAIIAGIVQLMFTLGENGLEAWSLSQFDKVRAYALWHFHERPLNPAPFLSSRVLPYWIVTCILAPVVEEFFFRGLLFRALVPLRGIHRAALISSLAFGVMHIANEYFLSTFIFAMCQCYAYAISRTLWVPIVVHAVFNTAAFVHQYYFDVHWTRTLDEMVPMTAWKPEIACLLLSLMAGAWAAVAFRRSLGALATGEAWNARPSAG